MMILGQNGKVLILDNNGEFVSCISRTGVFFTSIATANDKLLLGTERGTIHAYHLASLQFLSEIPYQIVLLPNAQLNHNQEVPRLSIEAALLKAGPAVVDLQITGNMRFLMVSYADSSFAVIDRTCQSPYEAILGHSFGHFDRVSGLQWITREVQNNTSTQELEEFVTCSADLSVFVWRRFGDRWQSNYIDVAKCFDDSLSF